MLACETSETIVCHEVSNEHVLLLNKEFEPYQQKSTGKRRKTFTITIILRMHSRMNRLNPRTPKHRGFHDLTHFM